MYKLGYLYSDNRYNRQSVAYTDFLIPTPPIIGIIPMRFIVQRKTLKLFFHQYTDDRRIYIFLV